MPDFAAYELRRQAVWRGDNSREALGVLLTVRAAVRLPVFQARKWTQRGRQVAPRSLTGAGPDATPELELQTLSPSRRGLPCVVGAVAGALVTVIPRNGQWTREGSHTGCRTWERQGAHPRPCGCQSWLDRAGRRLLWPRALGTTFTRGFGSRWTGIEATAFELCDLGSVTQPL